MLEITNMDFLLYFGCSSIEVIENGDKKHRNCEFAKACEQKLIKQAQET